MHVVDDGVAVGLHDQAVLASHRVDAAGEVVLRRQPRPGQQQRVLEVPQLLARRRGELSLIPHLPMPVTQPPVVRMELIEGWVEVCAVVHRQVSTSSRPALVVDPDASNMLRVLPPVHVGLHLLAQELARRLPPPGRCPLVEVSSVVFPPVVPLPIHNSVVVEGGLENAVPVLVVREVAVPVLVDGVMMLPVPDPVLPEGHAGRIDLGMLVDFRPNLGVGVVVVPPVLRPSSLPSSRPRLGVGSALDVRVGPVVELGGSETLPTSSAPQVLLHDLPSSFNRDSPLLAAARLLPLLAASLALVDHRELLGLRSLEAEVRAGGGGGEHTGATGLAVRSMLPLALQQQLVLPCLHRREANELHSMAENLQDSPRDGTSSILPPLLLPLLAAQLLSDEPRPPLLLLQLPPQLSARSFVSLLPFPSSRLRGMKDCRSCLLHLGLDL
mmetsp:Transcript_19267/g.44203  ORF Transcript_19267/g.44203 Transcript_19267/m.44203 type:complete len:441 (-) Transcript_19267:2605-3927(-)